MAKSNLQEEALKNAATSTYQSDATKAAANNVASYGSNPYGEFKTSQKTNDAYNYLQQTLAAKPEAYQSNYTDTISNLLGQIVNRDKFSYDFNADPLYHQYKNQYMAGGKQAMADTIAQASNMTGGYGNSYAATAGNQAYQNYLSQLNNVIPELYDKALNKYQMEGEDLRNRFNTVGTQEDREYGQWSDNYHNWQNDRNFGLDQYNSFWNQDMSEQNFNSGNWQNDRNFAYQNYRDLVGDDNNAYNNAYNALYNDRAFDTDNDRWNAEMAYQRERDAVKDEQWAREFALAQAKAASSGSKSGSGSSKNTGKQTPFARKDSSPLRDEDVMNTDAYITARTVLNESNDPTVMASYVGNYLKNGQISLDEADRIMDLMGISADDIDWNAGYPTLKYFDSKIYKDW